jgi:hypothetical protein
MSGPVTVAIDPAKPLNKPPVSSRTLWMNAAAVLVFASTAIMDAQSVFHLPPPVYAGFGIAVGTLNFILRFDTNTSITGSNPGP